MLALFIAGASGRIQRLEFSHRRWKKKGWGVVRATYLKTIQLIYITKKSTETHGHLLASSDALVSPMSIGKYKRQTQRSKQYVIFELC